MIDETKVLREVRWLEKEVEGMRYPTKTEFLKAIKEMKKRLEEKSYEIEIPEFLRR